MKSEDHMRPTHQCGFQRLQLLLRSSELLLHVTDLASDSFGARWSLRGGVFIGADWTQVELFM